MENLNEETDSRGKEMPQFGKNVIGITVYFNPEQYRKLNDSRNPKISQSEYLRGVIEKSLDI
jgi:hypothetical protein